MLVAFGLPSLYVIFFIALTIKTSLINSDPNSKNSKKQYGTFIQVFAINTVNVIGCAVIFSTLFKFFSWTKLDVLGVTILFCKFLIFDLIFADLRLHAIFHTKYVCSRFGKLCLVICPWFTGCDLHDYE